MSALSRFQQLSSRPLAPAVLALVMNVGLGLVGLQAAPLLDVTLDQAKVARVPEGTKTLVIGSPIVADVTLLKGSNTMVVTGKGFGETNLIALDGEGNILDEKMIRVAPTNSVLVVQRGMDRESYSCTPLCMPAVQLGDGPQFSNASGQITARNGLAAPAASPQQAH
jgi:Flp pilus assembly secretin CpaC